MLRLALLLFLQLSLVLTETEEPPAKPSPIYSSPCWLEYDAQTVGGGFPGVKIPFIVGEPRHIVRYGSNFGTVDPKSKEIQPLGQFLPHDAASMGQAEILFLPPGPIGWYSILDIFKHGLPSNTIAVSFHNESIPEFICRPRWYQNFEQEIEPLGITQHARSGESSCRCRKRVSGGVANQTLYDIALLSASPPIEGEWPEEIKRCNELAAE